MYRLEQDLSKKSMKSSKAICEMLGLNIKDFYLNIGIPIKIFKNEDWNINKLLVENEDILFFNKKYFFDSDLEMFYQIFYKYVDMIKINFDSETDLYLYLLKWTDISEYKWKSVNRSYLKKIINTKKYSIIAPNYLASYFNNLCKSMENKSDIEIKQNFIQHLEDILGIAKKEINLFKNKFNHMVKSYVYFYPHLQPNTKSYMSIFINNVIKEILILSSNLIDLNIYAIHPIVSSIIDEHICLDSLYLQKGSAVVL